MKPYKIGIFGAGRGLEIAKNFALLGCEITAVCEDRPERLAAAAGRIPAQAAVYHDFDAFMAHGFDAVVLANFFHEHAPYAIECLRRGIAVFSECTAAGTLAEAVALVRAFEKHGGVYMLAENYPQMLFNREMKRVADGGTLGKILYAEGEYNHPGNARDVQARKNYTYFPAHWRNHLPRTYYITHSLGPVMYITGAVPKRVTALAAFSPVEGAVPTANFGGDKAAIVTTLNDDGSLFRVVGCAGFGAHHNAYRICGTKGQIENLRGMDGKIMLRYNDWDVPEGMKAVQLYDPAWNDPDEEAIKASGHGGGDYLTARMFLDCLDAGKQPPRPFDVYGGACMAAVGILAHRSVLAGGTPFDVPDFRKEEERARVENDRLSPFVSPDDPDYLPCCSHPDFAPDKEQMALYRRLVMGEER